MHICDWKREFWIITGLEFEEMALLRLNAEDIAGFKLLFFLAIIYGVASALVYSVIHMKLVTPLDFDAPIDRFSEARAVEHVRVLSQDIGGRQVHKTSIYFVYLFRKIF